LHICSVFTYSTFVVGEITLIAGRLAGEAVGYAFIVIAPSAILGKLTKRTYIGLILSGIIIYIFEWSNSFGSSMKLGISYSEVLQNAGGFTPIVRALTVIDDGFPAPLVIIIILSYVILRSKELFNFLENKPDATAVQEISTNSESRTDQEDLTDLINKLEDEKPPCINCNHYDAKYRVCTKFSFNVHSYPKKYKKLCDGEFFQEKVK